MLCDSGVKLAACVTVCHQHVVCMQINIGGGHQLETKASEPEAAAPTTAAAAAAHKPVGVQSASSADGSEPELQEMPNQSLPKKRRRVMDSQPDMSEHDESEGNSVPTNQGAPSPAVLQSTAHTERPDDRQGSDNISSDVDDNDDDDDNDDLLVVKRRDVLSDSNAAAAAEGGIPLGGVELRGNKKRKKLRIDPGKTSGARTVFDEAGESLQPLALLAKEQLDRSAHLLPVKNTFPVLRTHQGYQQTTIGETLRVLNLSDTCHSMLLKQRQVWAPKRSNPTSVLCTLPAHVSQPVALTISSQLVCSHLFASQEPGC